MGLSNMITFAFLPPKELSAWLEKAQKDQLTAALTFLEDDNPKRVWTYQEAMEIWDQIRQLARHFGYREHFVGEEKWFWFMLFHEPTNGERRHRDRRTVRRRYID